MLLHWEMGMLRPSNWTGGKGEPVATRARPFVQRYKSAGRASECSVGFDRGKMMGRSTLAAISRTTGSVKADPIVERPMRTVARTLWMTSARPMLAEPVCGQDDIRLRGCA